MSTSTGGRARVERGSCSPPRTAGTLTLTTSAPESGRRRSPAPALAPLRIHDLRHTTASFAIAAGADVKTLQTMLGHASAVMTLDRYGHLMPGRGQEVANLLDALARAATAEPISAAVRLDARDFRGMDLEPTSRKSTKNAG